MAVKDQNRSVQFTPISGNGIGGREDNWNTPLILAMTVLFAVVGASLWTKSPADHSAPKERQFDEDIAVRAGEYSAIRMISPHHQAEYVDVVRGDFGWQRRDAHTGRPLTHDQLSTAWLTYLQLRGQDETWTAVNSSNQLEIVRADQSLWKSLLPGQRREELMTSCSLCADRNLVAVTSQTGTLWLLTFDETSASMHDRHQFEEPLVSASLSPAGDQLLLITGRHELLIWSIAESEIEQRIAGGEAGLRFAAWSADGRRFVTFGTNQILDVRNAAGELIKQIELSSQAVVAAALSPDGAWLAAGDGTRLCLWRLDSDEEPSLLDGHESLITALAFDDDSRALFSGDNQGLLRRWALLDHREVWMSP